MPGEKLEGDGGLLQKVTLSMAPGHEEGGSPALGVQQRVLGSRGERAKALEQGSWWEEMSAPPGVLVGCRVVGMGNREVGCRQDTLEEESGGARLRWGLGREDP